MSKQAAYQTIQEGLTNLLVPSVSIGPLPPKEPAFYNPKARVARDLSILMIRAVTRTQRTSVTFADSFAGVGARGLRVAVEAPEVDKVFINDINYRAVDLARTAAHLNGVFYKCLFSKSESCRFLIEHSAPEERFSIVDVDPFGSPAPFINCSIRALQSNGVLSVGATDTTVLCGVYPKVARRKYHGYSLNTDYCHEIGIRLLLGLIALTATRLDAGISPLFAHSTGRYMRTFVSVRSGSSKAEATASKMGYIFHCFRCDNRVIGRYLVRDCDSCGGLMKTSGPLWTGPLYDRDTLVRSMNFFEPHFSRETYRLLALAIEEAEIPTYFVVDKIADRLQVPSPSLQDLVRKIQQSGFVATRTAFNPLGIRTNAPAKFIRTAIVNR